MCPFKTVSLPESVKNFGTGIFSGCDSLVSIHLPSTMTKIPMDMFLGDTKLVTINIPNGVIEFDEECFMGCTSLTDFEIRNNVTTVQANAFHSGVNPVQPSNVPSLITSVDSLSTIDLRPLQFINAYLPMSFIDSGRFVNLFKLVQL